jgi:Zn-dependent protease with chaperone function
MMKFKNCLSKLVATTAVLIVTACATPRTGPVDGVKVGESGGLKNMVPALQLEQAASKQYADMKVGAAKKNALAPENHPDLIRIRAIAKQLLPYAQVWNPQAQNWKWEINLFVSDEVNAFCMPGGKIAFYTGILQKLKLNDDEVATVMGHEIAHALREHARERIATAQVTNLGANILSQALGLGNLGNQALGQGLQLVTLSFSRSDEKDADLVGMDLAARAGYDPRAGISLWQKMSALPKSAPPEWLSTHPSGESRIAEIQKNLFDVMPLYAKAKNTTIDRLPAYKY